MKNVLSNISCVACALFIIQGLLILKRCVPYHRRNNAFLLTCALIFSAAYPLFGGFDWLREMTLIAAMGTTGAFLSVSVGKGRTAIWAGSAVGLLLILLFGEAMGYRRSLPFQILRAFGITAMGAVCLGLLNRLKRSARSRLPLLSMAAAALLMACGLASLGVRLAGAIPPFDMTAIPFFFLSMCTGWLVFQEGYPERDGWNGALRGISSSEDQTSILRVRLMALENALARQDRLVAAGTVAAGAAHEFKNVLSSIGVSAAFGLGQSTMEGKDRALRLVVDHTQSARASAIDTLERLATEGRENARLIDAAHDLEPCLRRERAALRASGIVMEASLKDDVAFEACPGDVEQVLHNLIQNAAQAYVGLSGADTVHDKVIRISSRRLGDYAVIEVRDSAGGVSRPQRGELFALGSSGSGSTGIGLYLSRNLVQANGGTLEYEPADKGSIFRIVLPAEDREGTQE